MKSSKTYQTPTDMLYHSRRRNDHPLVQLIKKRNTPEWLAEGMIKLDDKSTVDAKVIELSSHDIFDATMIFNQTGSFQLTRGSFCIGICDRDDPWNTIMINVKHRTISDHLSGRLRMFFDLPKINEGDMISITWDEFNMYLTINGKKTIVFDLTLSSVKKWQIRCLMGRGHMKYYY